MEQAQTIDVSTLQKWLEHGKPVTILDVRPLQERSEWAIPGSVHLDVYDQLKSGDTHALAKVSLPQNTPLVTVCAAGRMSLKAAGLLQERGFEVYSLNGGMKAWSMAYNTAVISTTLPDVTILQIRRTGKGCLSYLIASLGEALVIDASLDEKVYTDLTGKYGWQIRYVLDTHLHADHLSRSGSLAKNTGARLFLPDSPKFEFSYEPVTAQTIITIGQISLKAIPTPGHTLESFSYLLGDKVLFTGDSLFVDGIGRPDLKANPAETRTKAELLYQSIRSLLSLPASLIVLPGHTSKPVAFDGQSISATIGDLAIRLPLMQLSGKDFTEAILSKIPATPSNYLAISELNSKGDFSSVEPGELEVGANRCAIS